MSGLFVNLVFCEYYIIVVVFSKLHYSRLMLLHYSIFCSDLENNVRFYLFVRFYRDIVEFYSSICTKKMALRHLFNFELIIKDYLSFHFHKHLSLLQDIEYDLIA